MRKARNRPIEEQIDYSYEGRSSPPDLLDYRYMDLVMSRQADTGKISCLGTFVLALMLLSCGVGLALIVQLFR